MLAEVGTEKVLMACTLHLRGPKLCPSFPGHVEFVISIVRSHHLEDPVGLQARKPLAADVSVQQACVPLAHRELLGTVVVDCGKGTVQRSALLDERLGEPGDAYKLAHVRLRHFPANGAAVALPPHFTEPTMASGGRAVLGARWGSRPLDGDPHDHTLHLAEHRVGVAPDAVHLHDDVSRADDRVRVVEVPPRDHAGPLHGLDHPAALIEAQNVGPEPI
mmetsp:Transcript_105916/g.299874  ORF Transcript_105916/g.299874 Transcript_105916/m.299874 type:complete len:219 (-) Transcript_105916:49-705(-)